MTFRNGDRVRYIGPNTPVINPVLNEHGVVHSREPRWAGGFLYWVTWDRLGDDGPYDDTELRLDALTLASEELSS